MTVRAGWPPFREWQRQHRRRTGRATRGDRLVMLIRFEAQFGHAGCLDSDPLW